MREIVRCIQADVMQYVGVDWASKIGNVYTLLCFNYAADQDELLYNQNVEILYKKWLVGENCSFTIDPTYYNWDIVQELQPKIVAIEDKAVYLMKKAIKAEQELQSKVVKADILGAIAAIEKDIPNIKSIDEQNNILKQIKNIEDTANTYVANATQYHADALQLKCLLVHDYDAVKEKIKAIYDLIKVAIKDVHYNNYNLIAPKVEVAYIQSKTDDNYKETRNHLVTIQQEVIQCNLERWQKNELMDRMRTAFDNLNTRQNAWRATQDEIRNAAAAQLAVVYTHTLLQLDELNFNDAFNLLKTLQEKTNKCNLTKEDRAKYYVQLDNAFTLIKEKANLEQDANYAKATELVHAGIASSKAADQFKAARALLTQLQDELKGIRLQKEQKDELFGLIRVAFKALNDEQDAYYAHKRKQNAHQAQHLLHTLEQALQRKQDGMEKLYQAKSNIESKTGMIKISKNSTSDLLQQFNERLADMNTKIAAAQKDVQQLETKITKLRKEITEDK